MKKRITRFTALLLTAVLCAGLCSCSKTEKDATVRFPLPEEPQVLDPQIVTTDSENCVVANCFEGLMKADASGKIVPAAAEQISVSSDGLTYIFTIKKDAKWHINTNHEDLLGEGYETAIDLNVTSMDFAFGLQHALDPNTKAPNAQMLYMIKNAAAVNQGKKPMKDLGVKALDRYRLQITLEYPGSGFLQALTEPVAMPCSRAFFEATKGRYGLNAACMLCNGPFYLSRWYENDSIVLRRNPDNGHFSAKVYQVNMPFAPQEDVLLKNLADGVYVSALVQPGQAEALEKDGVRVDTVQNGLFALFFNCADEVTKSTTLRLALTKALDFSAFGSAQQVKGLIPPSCTVNGHSFAEVSPSIGRLSYDEQKAREYYRKVCGKDGISLSVLCPAEYENAVRTVMQNWQKVFGISFSVQVASLSEEELKARLESGDYQCILTSVETDAQTPLGFLNEFQSRNYCRFAPQKYNTLLDAVRRAANDKQEIEAATRAQAYLIENAVVCPLSYTNCCRAVAKNVQGLICNHSGKTVLLHDMEIRK